MAGASYTVTFVLCFSLSGAFAQPADTTNYFPLEIGNSWTYYGVGHPGNTPPDTAIGVAQEIAQTLSVNDTLYYLAPHENSLADTLRDDGAGRIFARYRGRDVLLYDFTLADGEKYLFALSEFVADTFEVTVDRNVTVDVVAGHFENCIRLTFDIPLAVDDQRSFVFAPNVGIVTGTNGMGVSWYLYEAVVGDRVVSRPKSYFPLAIGNSWTYIQILNPGDPPTVIVGPAISIDESFYVNDTLYYRAPHIFGFADTLRDDGEGRIWARVSGREVLLFDFTLGEGRGYQFEPSWSTGDPFDVYEVTVRRDRTVDVVAGRFENCVSFWFDIPEAIDDEHFWVFAPGVGIVEGGGFVGDYRELQSALIGGKVISSTEGTPLDAPFLTSAYAYPNPFRDAATIFLPNDGDADSRAIVYDILGREVRRLTAGDCSVDGCTFRWNGDDAPNGVYFVVGDEGRRDVVSIVVSR